MPARAIAPLAAVALAIAGVAAVLVGLAITGAAQTPLLLDPGPFVRYGIPITTLVTNVAASVTIGPLILVLFAVPSGTAATERLLRVAGIAAAAWTLAELLSTLLAFAEAIGKPLRLDETFSAGLWQYLTSTESGQARLWAVGLTALVTIIIAFSSGPWLLAGAVALSAAALVAVSQLGHQGGTADHDIAWGGLFLHMAFAAAWLGGLVGILFARDRTVVERYSSVALVSFLVVAGSGIVSAWIRIGGFDGLWTSYGVLVIIKALALLTLGAIGILHRAWAIRRLPKRSAFWGIVVGELALMGIASGMAAALASSAPPVDPTPGGTSPAELLTGAPLPPDPSFERYMLGISLDPIWLALIIAAAAFYLLGVIRLARRGDRWPVLRTVSWFAGLVVLLWATNGGIGAYVDMLFSAHMLMHMVIGMLAPVLLVPGAPITLLLRAVAPRKDGSRGAREWALAGVHSWFGRTVANPYVAAAIFVLSLWVFYYTPLFRWATTTHLGHEWMIVHFLISGYLFAQALIGVDPGPARPPYPVRLIILLATMAVHAFFGLAIMSSTGVLLADWFGAMGWDTGVSALQDQQRAGGIAWSVGEIPTLALAIAVAIQWARSDTREQRRIDRKADRDGDADLAAYNAMLERAATRDRDAADERDRD
ncbi:MAG TPA: cytochrome c oxidase assembly protein [Microbacteriaceae bacterium]|nr:cytochrome c oxidase assembly protein [Microbacteriaceae bacterium]